MHFIQIDYRNYWNHKFFLPPVLKVVSIYRTFNRWWSISINIFLFSLVADCEVKAELASARNFRFKIEKFRAAQVIEEFWQI